MLRVLAGVCALVVCLSATGADAPTKVSGDYRRRLAQDEIVYFLLPDRFENGDPSNDSGGAKGGRLITGFDPTSKGFYHGGDLKGLIARLDYIQGLGATAVWLGPIYKNRPVQGAPGHESAGYHGYWITDFTHVDPHLGSDADMHALVQAVHARGMKLYLDIVTNHTADVIAYRECPKSDCPYRSRADYPYTRRGGLLGERINPGFLGDSAPYQNEENFAKLVRPDYAYTPFVPVGEEHRKVPDWLNDPIYYHNRGNSTFHGESSTMGDFSGLDDLFTENPRVLQGFIDIYGSWIDKYDIDGFRIDTAQHVNPEFWQRFVPAMQARAAAKGIAHFHIFGEVFTEDFNPAQLARHTRLDRLPAVLDFGFALAVSETVAGTMGTDRLAELFADDALYEGGAAGAQQLPIFISNHDMGRFGYFVRKGWPLATEDEVLRRVTLGYAMLMTLRGVPVIYYGDEQGFAGSGGDQDARQDLFASKTAAYNAERLVGTSATTAQSNFVPDHPLYKTIAALAALRSANAALRRGEQVVRAHSLTPGIFAVSRFEGHNNGEVLIVFNTSMQTIHTQVEVDSHSEHFQSLHGVCAPASSAPGSYPVQVAALDYIVCTSESPQ
ncbi:MAG: alpha-amylase family glycosyl hydrolase [Pseudomonadota bacterium]|nr:alpha-amylase family glycosyl hydrolase [Pseudomonadota bacterium]